MTALLLLLVCCIASLVASFDYEDVLSDIVYSSDDVGRALEAKSEGFWKPVLSAAQEVQREEHLTVYAEVEIVIAELPAESGHVRDLLTRSVKLLRGASDLCFSQVVQSAELAWENLANSGEADGTFSFLTGGQNFISEAIRRLTGEARYSGRVAEQIARRQIDVLPLMRGASSVSADVHRDCRLGVELAFDVLKYDVYNEGVPETPEAAKAAAKKLVGVGGETRRHFLKLISEKANSIDKDTAERDANPSGLVTGALFADLEASLGEESVDHLEHVPGHSAIPTSGSVSFS